MRLSIVVCALLAVAAQPPACGSPTAGSGSAIVGPWEAACQGLACGDPCGFCPPGTDAKGYPAPAVCDFAGRCVPKGPFVCYDPCAGKACGATCHLCPPGALDCAETAVVKACDRNGLCQMSTPALTCP
jgi:hypothetical protein